MQFTRFRPARGVFRAVSTDSIVLLVMQRNCWNLKNNRRGVRSEVGWLRKSFVLAGHPHPKGTSYGDAEASSSGRSTQSAWKQCACARHTRLNRVKCTVARRNAQSTSVLHQNITPGIQRGPQSPWFVFLPYLSSNKERWGPRRALV